MFFFMFSYLISFVLSFFRKAHGKRKKLPTSAWADEEENDLELDVGPSVSARSR